MGKSIGIISLKGGVGKTSIVAGLGASIANFDKKVLLVDGNLSAPNLGFHLNVINPKISLHHVLTRKVNPSDAICSLRNFDIIPASVFDSSRVNNFALKNRIKFLKNKYDVILFDSSPALNEETLAVMLASDSLFVVTTPDYPSLSTTIKAIKEAKQRGTSIHGLILNKVNNKNFDISLNEIEKIAEVPVLAVLPYDINCLKALSELVPFADYKPNSEGSRELRKLAAALIGEKGKEKGFKRIFRFIPKKQDINREVFYESFFS